VYFCFHYIDFKVFLLHSHAPNSSCFSSPFPYYFERSLVLCFCSKGFELLIFMVVISVKCCKNHVSMSYQPLNERKVIENETKLISFSAIFSIITWASLSWISCYGSHMLGV
jgi:hypothetical protein